MNLSTNELIHELINLGPKASLFAPMSFRLSLSLFVSLRLSVSPSISVSLSIAFFVSLSLLCFCLFLSLHVSLYLSLSHLSVLLFLSEPLFYLFLFLCLDICWLKAKICCIRGKSGNISTWGAIVECRQDTQNTQTILADGVTGHAVPRYVYLRYCDLVHHRV